MPVFWAINLSFELSKISLLDSKGLISVVMGSFEVGPFEVFVNEEFHFICFGWLGCFPIWLPF